MKTKNSSQENPPKKILPRKSSSKNPPKKILPKKILQKNSSKKILQKNPKIKKKTQKTKQFPNNFSKIPNFEKSNSLYRTWRPKTLSGFFFHQIKYFMELHEFVIFSQFIGGK